MLTAKGVERNKGGLVLINGLEVRVLPGSPKISPNLFYFHQFNRPRGTCRGRGVENIWEQNSRQSLYCIPLRVETVWVASYLRASTNACPSLLDANGIVTATATTYKATPQTVAGCTRRRDKTSCRMSAA